MWKSSTQSPAVLDTTDLSSVLIELDETQLSILSAWLLSVAHFTRERAQALRARAASQKCAESEINNLRRLPVAVAQLMLGGLDEKSARARAAYDAAVPVETVDLYCKAKDRARAKILGQARALKVARMYALGKSCAEIALELTCSKRTVERLIARLNRKTDLQN